MRLNQGKLKNGTELKHLPPLYMQSEPIDLDLAHVRKQIFTWQEAANNGLDRSVIHTESAMEIASWWSLPGSAFAAFAFDGEILPSLTAEITEQKALLEHESSQQALDALESYVSHTTARKGN